MPVQKKVFFPLDVDIIREQVTLGKFKYLDAIEDPPMPPSVALFWGHRRIFDGIQILEFAQRHLLADDIDIKRENLFHFLWSILPFRR
jgi:hypothetical protein